MSVTAKVRKLVIQRDNESCVACGSMSGLTIHHRINRGAGGSKLYDTPAFLLTMCAICNASFESSSASAERARELGYKLLRHQKPPAEPTLIPVFYYREGDWFLLNEQGEKWLTKPLSQ